MQKIVLDVIPSGIQPRVYVDQYDLGRQFQITFKEGIGDYAFAPGTIIKINGRKSDGHVFEYTESSKWDATHYVISKSGSGASTVVTISTTEQMTAAAGDADVQLTLQNSAGAVIGTLNFIMVVQMRPSAAGDPSESDLPDLVRSVNNILPDADGNVQISPVGDGIGASNISTVEPTRTMRTAYSAGDYVYVTEDDQLYKVTSPIGANGTLTPGTNAVACVLTSELAVKTGTFTTNTTNHPNVNTNISVKQFGSVVSINGYLSNLSALSSTDARRLGTISGVSLPSSFIRTICAFADHAYDPPSEVIYLSIDNSTGNVGVNLSSGSQSATNKSVYFSVCYVV